MSKLGRWSTTPGSNNATPPDGWPEGQAPSTVNDCAREMMASIRTVFNDVQYFDHDFTPTFINATSFSVPGNQTSAIHAGRRLKLFDSNPIYGHVTTASFTTVTTVHITATASLTSSLSSFGLSIISNNADPLPRGLGRFVPVGGIIAWSGLITAIPTGWALCNGNNGTPDLRNRFIVGAGSFYVEGGTGGTADAITVAHTHAVSGTTSSDGSHTHGVSDPGHTHTATFQSQGGSGYPGLDGSGDAWSTAATGSSGTGISINADGAHTHTFSVTSGSTGSSGTNANLPPYYALAYIMCLG